MMHGPGGMRGPGGAGMWHGHPGGWRRGGMACAVHYGQQNVMLNRVHDRLKITAAEEPAWKNFTTQINAALAPIGEQCRTAETPPPPPPAATLPERLANMQKQISMRAQVIGQVEQAVSTMYGQLSPEQKQTADHMMRPPMGRLPMGHPPVPPAPPAH